PRHRADLREPLPRESDRDGADRAHRDIAVLFAERGDLLDDTRGVLHGARVGHGMHRREAAGRGCPGPGQHCLALLEAGLAEVRVQVDETWERLQAVGVDDGRPGRVDRVDEDAVADRDVASRTIGKSRALDQDRTGAQKCHTDPPPWFWPALSTRYRTAIRIETPFVT